MGRAVRSNADYAVIVMCGPELACFTAKADIREVMSADVRAQIELGHKLAYLAQQEGVPPEDAFDDLADRCLKRDRDWRAYYDESVRNERVPPAPVDKKRIAIAQAERRAARAAHAGNPVEAVRLLSEQIPEDEGALRGRLLQSLANYTHPYDPAKAAGIQSRAFALNPSLQRPPAGVGLRLPAAPKLDTASRILEWLTAFTNPNGAIARWQEISAGLSFAGTAEVVERSLADAAVLIGAEGVRAEREYGSGPDDLYLWSDYAFVIEAKTEARYTDIPKKDAEQLLHSVEWFKKNYPSHGLFTPILVCATTQLADGVFLPGDARIVTTGDLRGLVDAIAAFVTGLVAQRVSGGLGAKEVGQLLTAHHLTPRQIVQKFSSAPTLGNLR